jgi:4-amino-4-deoxy-L-arabinose transferase-like glycosyltransferase
MPRVTYRAGLAAAALFILLGALFIPYAGIQADEALFSTPLFPHIDKDLRLPWLPPHIPMMVMTYVGTLKTWIYWPIMRIFGTGPWAVRLPVVLIGAITVFVFFHLARASGGALAAVLGAFLLATDPVFLLTNTFDWGPVALEHAFLVTGCWFVYRFGSHNGPDARLWNLAAGFFCWGLALWNKAIFIWALSGLIGGGVLVFWPEIRRWWRLSVLLVAAAAFLCGALPVVTYNLRHANATLTENAHLDTQGIARKWIQVRNAANGASLFRYMVGEEWWPSPKAPQSTHGRVAVWIREHLGEHKSSGLYYVYGALLLAVPWWWKFRAARFSLVFMAVSWPMMAFTHDAGNAAHHVVLLWPFPILFAAVALASLPWRPLAWTTGALMIAMNLLVVNQYIEQFERDGAGDVFTDALYPLSASLDAYADRTLYVIDWGLAENLNLLHEGRLNILFVRGPLDSDSPSAEDLAQIKAILRDSRGLILDHVTEHEVFPKGAARLDQAAHSFGYRREVVRTIPDSNGRPMFEISRYISNTG